MQTFFPCPTQVIAVHELRKNSKEYLAGIAYNEEFICGGCGSIIPLVELEDIYSYRNWVPISKEIYGDYIPEEFEEKYPDFRIDCC